MEMLKIKKAFLYSIAAFISLDAGQWMNDEFSVSIPDVYLMNSEYFPYT
jgi:hypothetical protein